jgi:hypothetical protein
MRLKYSELAAAIESGFRLPLPVVKGSRYSEKSDVAVHAASLLAKTLGDNVGKVATERAYNPVPMSW